MNGPTETVTVHRGRTPYLNVTARVSPADVVVLDQGDSRIAVPLEEFGRFVDNLERIYTGQAPVVADGGGA